MALGNAAVSAPYAERLGTSPALPSRFLQRLDAFIGAAEAKQGRARACRRWLVAGEAI